MEVLILIFDDGGVESEFSDDGVVKSEFSDHKALNKFSDSSAVKYYFAEKKVDKLNLLQMNLGKNTNFKQ